MTKVVAVEAPPCEFCGGNDFFVDNDSVTIGRVYTVERYDSPCEGWILITLVEVSLPPGAWWCHCGFREIEGDEDAWKRLLEENRPKTRELEPA